MIIYAQPLATTKEQAMGTITPKSQHFIPLTREVFGPNGDRVLDGVVEAFGSSNDFGGAVLMYRDHETDILHNFVHPELLDFTLHANLHRIVRVTLEDDIIVVRQRYFESDEVRDEEPLCTAPPIQPHFTTAHMLMSFLDQVKEAEHCARETMCVGAKQRTLRPDKSVQVVQRHDVKVTRIVCHACYREMRDDPEVKIIAFFDGSRIIPHAPVPMLSAGTSRI